MDKDKPKNWYKVVRAHYAIYTDPVTGKNVSENVVMLFGGVYRTFGYPQDGVRNYLLKVGDEILIEGSPYDGNVLLYR